MSNSRISTWVRVILIFVVAMFIGLTGHSLPTATAATAPAASVAQGNDSTKVAVQKLVAEKAQTSTGDTVMAVVSLLGPFLADPQKAIAEADVPAVLKALAIEAPAKVDNGVAQQIITVRPTEAAKHVDPNMPAVQWVDGTGNGQDHPVVVQDGVQYVTAPYAGSIFPGLPAPLGPDSYADSTKQGGQQAVANAINIAHPEYRGFSQGESAAWIANATDGKVSHLTGYGSPTNPGTGFVSSMPNNLLFTQIGNPPALQPGDTADLYSMTGDCWTNLPPLWSPLSWIACVPSTLDTHYGNPGYNGFHEDQTYESSPGITQHVMHTENGLVLLAEKVNPNLPEDQKQFLRDIAPQGQPGIQQGPTLRQIVEDPAAAVASTVDMLTKSVPAVAPQANSIPQAQAIPLVTNTDTAPQDQFQAYVDNGTQMLENLANGTGNPDVVNAVNNVVNTVNQVVDTFTAPATPAPVQNAAPAQAPAPTFTAPVGNLADLGQQVTNTVNQLAGNNGVNLAAIAGSLLGAH